MGDRDRRVRDEAYRIWDEAGRPQGRDDEHWFEAEKRVSAGEAKPRKEKAAKAVKPVVKGMGSEAVAVPVANDQPKPKAKKGAAVDVAPVKSKKTKAAPSSKDASGKAAKGEKPKSKA